VKGYNPHKPGRPSHSYHTYLIANLRLVLEVEVQDGNRTASKYSAPGLWELLGRVPRAHWPALLRGDRDWGSEANMARAEQEALPFLFKLRLTQGVKKTIERLLRGASWSNAGQGWQGAETTLRLQGWSRARRAVVLRRQVRADLAMVDASDPEQLRLSFAELTDDTIVYEYAVLVTSLGNEILTIAQLYRDRADAENAFDELKNHWGWGGFTTQDLKRCRFMARITALIYNWWSLFVRLADPTQHTEASPLPPAAAARPGPAHPPRWTDPHHHQPPARRGRLGPNRLPRDRGLLQDATSNCGAVDAPAALVRRALACPGEIPWGPPVTRFDSAARAAVNESLLRSRAVRGRRTARDGPQLPFLG
jgi:hypothetical protein